MAASEESATSQRRWVRGLEDMMLAGVDQIALRPCIVAPEQEHNAFALVGDLAYHRVREALPPYRTVRGRLPGTHSQHCIEKKHALLRPIFEIRTPGHLYAKVALNLLEYILEGRRCRHSVRDGE